MTSLRATLAFVKRRVIKICRRVIGAKRRVARSSEKASESVALEMNLQSGAFAQERPLQVRGDQTMQDEHSACRAGGTGQPTQAAGHRWASGGDPGSAACRGVECKASIAVGESRLGSWRRQLMDL